MFYAASKTLITPNAVRVKGGHKKYPLIRNL